MKHLILLILCTLSPLLFAAPPNVVIIFIDDLGYADIGPFGATKQKTPNLDKMAREGMKLTSFYAAPVCSVSRAQLMTGCYGARISVPTIGGPVTMTVPKGSNTGTTMRLRDRGIRNRKTGQRGHQLIILKAILPAAEEPELAAFLETWQPQHQQEPRKEMLS